MLKQHLHYFDNVRGNDGGQGDEPVEVLPQDKIEDERINPKMKQFYKLNNRLETFYSHGRIKFLSPCHFVCQCGPGIKIISTVEKLVKKENDPDQPEINPDEKEGKKKEAKLENFGVIAKLDSELDETTTFDASSFTQTLITAHRSGIIRIWNLGNHKEERIIRSYTTLPITLIEIDEWKAMEGKNNPEGEDVKPPTTLIDLHQENRSRLRWLTVAGSEVKIYEEGGIKVHKSMRVDSVPLLGFAKWDEGEGSERAFVAERNIYVFSKVKDNFAKTAVLEGHLSQVTGLEFGVDVIASGGRDKVLILWDKLSLKKLKTIAVSGVVECMGLLGVGKSDLYIALESSSQIKHFDLNKKQFTQEPVIKLGEHEKILGINIIAPSYVQDEFLLPTTSSVIYRMKKNSTSKEISIVKQYVGSLGEILAVTLWESDKVAIANNTSTINIYDIKEGSFTFLKGHSDIVMCLAAKDARLISGSKDNKVIVWSVSSNEPQLILDGHIASVTSVYFGKEFEICYSVGEDNFLKKWKKKKSIRSAIAHDKEIHSVHLNPNCSLVLTSSRDKTAKIWNSEDLSLVGILKGHKKSIWNAKFSQWDQLVVTASADQTIKIWNIAAMECISTLQGHGSSMLQAEFINNGLQVISSCSDGTFSAWDLTSSTCISTLECGDEKVWGLTSTPDGSTIVTGTADSVLSLWVDVTEERYNDAVARKKKAIEDDQILGNLSRKKDYVKLFTLAIQLDRPFVLLNTIREMENVDELKDVIVTLGLEDKCRLLDYIRKWNSSTKSSTEAQTLLYFILATADPKELSFLSTSSLIPYTEKHFRRVEKAQQLIPILRHIAKLD